MADDVKKVEVAITSTYDGKGAQQAAADQEALTNTGKGLATTLPQMSEATKAYTIRTEEEYLAVQKAHNALAEKITLLQAAGKETANYEIALANLSEALSTEQALTFAQTIEQKAANKAKLEAYEAAEAEKRAQLEEAEATQVNTVALREQLVVLRELMSGRLNRLPGSLSILAGASGAGPGLTKGIMAATMAFIGLDMAISAIEKHEAPLEKLLGEDLGEGIDKAQALATAWTGIADAVANADQEFNSATAIFDRSRKGASPQEALGDKANEVANAEVQAQNAERKAKSFKLPESDEEAKANADTMKARADAFRKQAEESKADAQRYNDMSVSASTVAGFVSSMFTSSTFWKGAWKQLAEGSPATLNPFGEFSKQAGQDAKEQTEAANSADREVARLNQEINDRRKARTDAERSASEAEKDKLEFKFESNPNNDGSLASKNAEISSGESEIATDFKRIQKDLSIHGPGAQQAMQDARDALQDVVQTLAAIAALGADVRGLRRELESVKQELEATSNRAYRAVNALGTSG